MASPTQTKTLCSKCRKAAGVLTCRGCEKDFCYRHVAEHREELHHQMDEVTINHDQLQQTITEQILQPKSHPLIKQIDTWEQSSIEKIHRAADEAREQLLNVVDKYRSKVADALELLTQELTKARQDDDYVETDLKEWIEKLDKLKEDLAPAQTIDFGQDNKNDNSLIPKIFIHDILKVSFETWFGDIQTTKTDKLILHGPTNEFAAVYSQGVYSSGQHTFRLQIQYSHSNQGFVFGIISKDAIINSYSSSLFNFNKIFRIVTHRGGCHQNGICLFSSNNASNPIQTNDILEIQIDCDRQKLHLINTRTNYQQEFSANLSRCKLPWRMVILVDNMPMIVFVSVNNTIS